jgi:RHS repeat-associated protein
LCTPRVVSSSGSLTASTAYDAWGNPETTGGLTTYTPFGYAGGYTDATGLSYLIHRYYDPQTGQFLAVDPLVDSTGQSYAYGADNPVDNVDPTGLCSKVVDGKKLPTDCASLWEILKERTFAVRTGRGGTKGALTRYVELLDHGDLAERYVNAFTEAQAAVRNALKAFQDNDCTTSTGAHDALRMKAAKWIADVPVPTREEVQQYRFFRAIAGGGVPHFGFGVGGKAPVIRFAQSSVTIVIG